MEESSDIILQNSKLQIKKMLRDAICVFCQSMLSYDLQLSVEALVGITVDGSDVLLVSVNERFEKTSVASHSMKVNTAKCDDSQILNCSYSGDNGITAVEHSIEHRVLQSEFDIAAGASKDVLQKDKSVLHVKVEDVSFVDDVHAYEVLPSDNGLENVKSDLRPRHDDSIKHSYFPAGDGFTVSNGKSGEKSLKRHSSEGCFQTKNVSTTNNITELDDHCLVFEDQLVLQPGEVDSTCENAHQSYDGGVKSSRCRFSNNSTRQSSSHSSSTTVSKAIVRRAQRQRFESAIVSYPSEVDTFRADSNVGWGRWQESNTGHQTAMKRYTCKLCNTQLGRLYSYNRHMRTHQGIAFRCMCGRYFTREDNMKAHSRRCHAVWQNATLNNNNS